MWTVCPAAITVRGIDVGDTSRLAVGSTLLKEVYTTFAMALVCGLVLGLIGSGVFLGMATLLSSYL